MTNRKRVTMDSAMAGQCYAGYALEEYRGASSTVAPFHVQKPHLSKKPLLRRKPRNNKGKP